MAGEESVGQTNPTPAGFAFSDEGLATRKRRHSLGVFRAPAVGLLSVAALCVLTIYSDLVMQGSWIAHDSLPIGALTLFLLLVTVGNRLAVRLRPGWALTRAEVLLIYAMLLAAAGIPSVGLTFPVLSVAVAPQYYNTAAGEVAATSAAWLRVTDPEVIRQYFLGLDPGAVVPWRAWLAPLVAWSLFAILVYTAFLSLTVLLRRAWLYDERLTFPLVQVPVEIAGRAAVPTGNRLFFGNPYAWAGLALPALLHGMKAVNAYWPSIPCGFVTPIQFGELFAERPWNALKDLNGFVYFSVIGLTYLLSSEVSLSLWFFFLLSRIEAVLFAALGFDDRSTADSVGFTPTWFLTNQMWGALLFYGSVLAVEGLRSGAREMRRLARSGDSEGALTLRLAFCGLAGSLALLGLWLWAAGGQLSLQLGGLVFWMLAMLSLARLVCAGGLLLIDTNYLPRDILYRVFGANVVRPADLVVLTYHNTVFAYYPQLTILPFLFNSMKLGDEAGLSPRRLAGAVSAAILVAIPISFAVALPLVYQRGALALSEYHLGAMARGNFNEMAGYLASPSTPQIHTPLALGAGAAVMALLLVLRRTVFWWPLSPLGYLVGSSFTVMHHLWFCVFLGWLANTLVRHYGGLREFMRFRPFFLGLVLGEFLTAAFWMVIDALLGIRGHNVFPGPG